LCPTALNRRRGTADFAHKRVLRHKRRQSSTASCRRLNDVQHSLGKIIARNGDARMNIKECNPTRRCGNFHTLICSILPSQ
jgi:hypothetical protein